MKAQKIKIELELYPEIAIFLSTLIVTSAKGDFTAQKMLTPAGIEGMNAIAQTICDQVFEKTDMQHLQLRNKLTSLSNSNNTNLSDFRKDILN